MKRNDAICKRLRHRLEKRLALVLPHIADAEWAAGQVWYPRAQQLVLQEVGPLLLAQGIAALAAMSPRCGWAANCTLFKRFVSNPHQNPGTTEPRYRTALRVFLYPTVLVEHHLRTPKVWSFYNSIRQPDHDNARWVCIDAHMWRMLLPSVQLKTRHFHPRLQEVAQRAVYRAAHEWKVPPAAMQATLWLWQRQQATAIHAGKRRPVRRQNE